MFVCFFLCFMEVTVAISFKWKQLGYYLEGHNIYLKSVFSFIFPRSALQSAWIVGLCLSLSALAQLLFRTQFVHLMSAKVSSYTLKDGSILEAGAIILAIDFFLLAVFSFGCPEFMSLLLFQPQTLVRRTAEEVPARIFASSITTAQLHACAHTSWRSHPTTIPAWVS